MSNFESGDALALYNVDRWGGGYFGVNQDGHVVVKPKRNGEQIDLVCFEPAHTDGDVYIHFHKADVLHMGDVWFNGLYPFIDGDAGGSISGMVRACDKALALVGSGTKIIPGHGPVGAKDRLQVYRDMLATVRDRVGALKTAGASEQEAVAKKPTADLDAAWATNFINGDKFVSLVYQTL